MVDRKRPPLAVWIVPLMFSLAGFYRVTQSPSFEVYRAVDIVQLLGSGVSSRYTSIAQARSDGSNGRIWGGMHYPSAVEISDGVGQAIANYVNQNSMQRSDASVNDDRACVLKHI